MKLFVTITLFSVTAVAGFSQQRSQCAGKPVNRVLKISNNQQIQQTPTDTVWGNFPFGSNISGTAIPTMWMGSQGDWVAGNNSYEDKAKVQAFTVTKPYAVEGCIFLFGYQHYGSADPNSKVVANLYDMDGTGPLSTGQGPTPNTVISGTSVDIPVSSIDTSSSGAAGFVVVTFPSPFTVSSDYAAGIDLTTLTVGDTVALVCSDTVSPKVLDRSFDKWSDDTWHSFLETDTPNWGLNTDIAIFPIADMGLGINEDHFINGIKLYQNYPNPFKNSSVLAYELENSATNVTVFINDLTGKLMKKMELGKVRGGSHTLNLGADEFASGTYYILVQADYNRLAKKMTIAK